VEAGRGSASKPIGAVPRCRAVVPQGRATTVDHSGLSGGRSRPRVALSQGGPVVTGDREDGGGTGPH
jgi:hypothetical protein